MSPLPQRKKSPEELQQLRDQLGIRQNPEEVAASPVKPLEPVPPTPEEIEEARKAAMGKRSKFEKRVTRSLKRSDWDPPMQARTGPTVKLVPDSAIPTRRHSDEELNDLRRHQALAEVSTEAPPSFFPKAASPFLLTPAYLMAFFGAACHYWQEIPLAATAGTGAAALLIAGWIFFFRKPSRHHSGLLVIISLLALSFAALHYFPQLRHAS